MFNISFPYHVTDTFDSPTALTRRASYTHEIVFLPSFTRLLKLLVKRTTCFFSVRLNQLTTSLWEKKETLIDPHPSKMT